jgi:hypothetical protein
MGQNRNPQSPQARSRGQPPHAIPVSLVGFKPIQEWECFDFYIGKHSAVEIREFFIPDFSTWEPTTKPIKKTLTASSNRLRRKAARRQQRLSSTSSRHTCALVAISELLISFLHGQRETSRQTQ